MIYCKLSLIVLLIGALVCCAGNPDQGLEDGAVYLSDLEPFSASNGLGPVEKDRSNGSAASGDGTAVSLNGRIYSSGLGVHAPSELKFALDGQYAVFAADVGVDDEAGQGGALVFEVYADGWKIYDSSYDNSWMEGWMTTRYCNVDVTGVQELKLVVNGDPGQDKSNSGDWAGARLYRFPIALPEENLVKSFSYGDAEEAIRNYPAFNTDIPEGLERIYPSSPQRNYPVIDAHVHIPFASEDWALVKKRVGIYAACNAQLRNSVKASCRSYPWPDITQMNLNAFLRQMDEDRISMILEESMVLKQDGACGVKIAKGFGLDIKDSVGNLLPLDTPWLDSFWEMAGQEKWTVSWHVADPSAWLEKDYAKAPSKHELVTQFIRVVKDHPQTIFVAIHLLNLTDSVTELQMLGTYLDQYPNLYVDTAARSQYLVNLNQDYLRKFFIHYQDRILFGTDLAGNPGVEETVRAYEEEFRYWETTGPTRIFFLNEPRVMARGLGLPADVLEKFYYKNALKVFYGMSEH